MKLKVVESFKDKYTNKVYQKDDAIEVTEERAKELLKTSYVVAEKSTENKKEEKAITKNK